MELFQNGVGTSAALHIACNSRSFVLQLHCGGGEWRPVQDLSMQCVHDSRNFEHGRC